MDKITHEVRQAHWESLILECNNSGMSKKAWLKKNHVNEKQFYNWQRRIRAASLLKAAAESPVLPVPAVDFAEIALPASQRPVTVATPSRPDAVLRMGKYTLEISNTVSAPLLETLLQVMAHAE